MKIGIISDTHGNAELFEKAVEWLTQNQKISLLYHLGDDYGDVALLGNLFIDTIQVPGIYDERYLNKTLPAKLIEIVSGLSILLVHSFDKDATKDDIRRSDIILSGHTHKEELRLVDGKLFMNPGHCKGQLDKNMPPTFGLLTIQDRTVTADIFGMNFKLVRTMDIVRSESGLYKG
ncbi:MAG: metallophosphatase family protein [Chitinispirillaceae bacterium]|jgi:hypothetical protein|nr:metallophosphatase family protein [Chitinispirillaceae bacterium]